MVPRRTLVCVDQPLDAPNLADLSGAVDNLLVSPHPVDPLLLGLALSCMAGNDPAAAPFLGRSGQTRQQQLIASAAKTDYINALVADVKAAGARRPVRTALREIANEMVMNAIFNAPVDGAGNRRYAGLPRSSEVVLEPDEQATLRWAVGERFVLLAVKDPFGSLTAAEILRRTTGPSPRPELGVRAPGGGDRPAHHGAVSPPPALRAGTGGQQRDRGPRRAQPGCGGSQGELALHPPWL